MSRCYICTKMTHTRLAIPLCKECVRLWGLTEEPKTDPSSRAVHQLLGNFSDFYVPEKEPSE